MKKVFKEVSQLVGKFGTKKAIAIVIITMLVSILMLLSSCNVTRVVKIPDSVSTADVPAPMTTNYKAGTLEYLN